MQTPPLSNRYRLRGLCLLTLSFFSVCVAFDATGQDQQRVAGSDWPQHLGPNRTGISAERGLLHHWPAGGPREVWRVRGGGGMSGLAISRGRLVTLVQRSERQFVVAHDASNGKPLWETAVAPQYENTMGNGPRATPTIAGDTVFAFTGEGILAALRLHDGQLLWSHNVVRDHGGKPANYGMASSPLVVDDLVVVTAGAPDATVVAYDAATGRKVWATGNDPAGYSSPVLLKLGGRRQVVIFSGAAVLGLAPQTGELLWRHPYVTDFECNIAAPLQVDDKVFVSAGENHGCVLLTITAKEDGFTIGQEWSSYGRDAVMRNEWQTSILLDGHLYGMDNLGSAGPVTHLTCVDARTGQRVWRQARFGKGNLIAADGKLFISTMDGELVVVRATPKGFDELGRTTVIGATRQAPALADGLLYLRDEREIVCLDVRQR
jgi:outer membrane protein assembly factor BamB